MKDKNPLNEQRGAVQCHEWQQWFKSQGGFAVCSSQMQLTRQNLKLIDFYFVFFFFFFAFACCPFWDKCGCVRQLDKKNRCVCACVCVCMCVCVPSFTIWYRQFCFTGVHLFLSNDSKTHSLCRPSTNCYIFGHTASTIINTKLCNTSWPPMYSGCRIIIIYRL